MLPRRDARHPRGWRGPDLPASRRRDRAVRGGDRQAVRPLLGARRVPERARHQDVEAVRELPHRPRPARPGRGRGGGPAPVLADALSQGARLHGRRARGGAGGCETVGRVLRTTWAGRGTWDGGWGWGGGGGGAARGPGRQIRG